VTRLWPRLHHNKSDDSAFTIIELTVAMVIIAIVFLSLSFAVGSGLKALGASRQRSELVEYTNAQLESMRALSWSDLGARTSDANYATAYPSGKYQGLDAVVTTSTAAPEVVTVVTTAPNPALPVPITVHRWVTWTDTAGGTGHQFKRLTVQVDWRENSNAKTTRTLTLFSVFYPGNQTQPINSTSSSSGSSTSSSSSTSSTAANRPPVAAFTVSPATPTSTITAGVTSVTFTGTGSSDPDGDTLTYNWDFGDGTSQASAPATVFHTYSASGNFTALLTVSDGRGATNSTSKTFPVAANRVNHAPTVAISSTPSNPVGTAPFHVDFNATGSDQDGDALTYSWNFGDGSALVTGISVSHDFNSAGTFTVTVTDTDTGGLTGSATKTVQANPLNCQITGGTTSNYFKNPSSNAVKNTINLDNNQKPNSNNFAFFAQTNAACRTVTGELPYNGGTFVVALSGTTSGSAINWSNTGGSFGSSDKFNSGSTQTGYIKAVDTTTGQTVTFAFSFSTT
jgi:prepilin-type N-terminal cleavage/methylation domain-containing protein